MGLWVFGFRVEGDLTDTLKPKQRLNPLIPVWDPSLCFLWAVLNFLIIFKLHNTRTATGDPWG